MGMTRQKGHKGERRAALTSMKGGREGVATPDLGSEESAELARASEEGST
jgi:hypothetical protein